jgi:hypothetical protein
MEQQTTTKYSKCAKEFMKSHIREYCNDLQTLDIILQDRDRLIFNMNQQYDTLLRQLEVLQDDNERLHDVEIDNIKLHQRIRNLNTSVASLQSYNFEMQSSLHTLRKRKCSNCNHKHECGCDKDLCQHCKRRNIQISYIVDNMELHYCDNNRCKSYYMTRFENCQCQACMFCEFRQENAERDEALSDIAYHEGQDAQHAESIARNIRQQIEHQIIDNNTTQQNE